MAESIRSDLSAIEEEIKRIAQGNSAQAELESVAMELHKVIEGGEPPIVRTPSVARSGASTQSKV